MRNLLFTYYAYRKNHNRSSTFVIFFLILISTMSCGQSEVTVPEIDDNSLLSIKPFEVYRDIDRDEHPTIPEPGHDEVDEPGSEELEPPKEPPKGSDPNGPKQPVIEPGERPNEHWIGGACVAPTDCHYKDSICLGDKPEGGMCSKECTSSCPDQDGYNSFTFCINDNGAGHCVPRCDGPLFPETNGCRPGYECQIRQRFSGGRRAGACVPEGTPKPSVAITACQKELDRLGIAWEKWDYHPQNNNCMVDDPIYVYPPVNGIEYRYYNQSIPRAFTISCEMALALHKLGEILKEKEIHTILDIGFFNCRNVAGTNKRSQHSFGRAIDIWAFEDKSGEQYILEKHWEYGKTQETAQTKKGRVLRYIADEMHARKVFNTVLTPEYNSKHANHFHVDLKPNADYLKIFSWENFADWKQNDHDDYWIGSNDDTICDGPAGWYDPEHE